MGWGEGQAGPAIPPMAGQPAPQFGFRVPIQGNTPQLECRLIPRTNARTRLGTAARSRLQHTPRLAHRLDGRFEVRCPQCESTMDQRPLGIGMPITNRAEAEFMVRNHANRAA